MSYINKSINRDVYGIFFPRICDSLRNRPVTLITLIYVSKLLYLVYK